MFDSILCFLKLYKDAFTSIGVLITFLISLGSLYFSARNNKAVHYVNSITKSRIEWIQDLRTTISEFISKINICSIAYFGEEHIKTGVHFTECKQLCSKIRLLLNYCDVKDREIIQLAEKILRDYTEYCEYGQTCEIDEFDFIIEDENLIEGRKIIEKNINLLFEKVQIYLKAEWNRVKYESQGKIYEKDTQRFDYKELEEKYRDNLYKNKVFARYFIDLYAKTKRILSYPQFYIFLIIILIIYFSI